MNILVIGNGFDLAHGLEITRICSSKNLIVFPKPAGYNGVKSRGE